MAEDTQPGKLPAMTKEEVKARAQRILDLRGKPPYSESFYAPEVTLSADECAVLSEFVQYWLPYLEQKAPLK